MKRSFTLIAMLGLLHGASFSQCVEVPENRVLLVGDSWASFENADQTITHGLAHLGHSNKKFASSVVIAENGAETNDFLTQDKQDAIQSLIDANPDIDIVHLSIGGNDVLGDWHVSFTQDMTDSMEHAVAGRLEEVIAFLKNTRPGMRVFWAGYTYPNFGEVINDIAPFQTNHPFYDTWNSMGQPDFLQINTLLNDFSDSVAAYCDSDPMVNFVRAQGVLQYYYGQAQPLGIAPGGTYPAFTCPLPLGYPDYPSPKEAMRLYAGVFTDCFHLSPDAYQIMFDYQALKFYQKFFMDDLYLLAEDSTTNGSVTSAGDVSQEIRIGEEGGNEVATVLTFKTQQMADTTISNASIFLRRSSLSGTDPFTGTDVHIKMKSGNFGTSADVEAVDFTADGDADGSPCQFGSHAKNEHWVRLDLTAEMIANINNGSKTQFVISIPGFTGGVMTFNNTSDPETAPILNLNYGPEPSSVADIRKAKEVPVYPIPTTGPLTIDVDMNALMTVDVINILGEVVMQPKPSNNRIDISDLKAGPYVLRITTKEGISTKRIIKR